MSAQTRKVMHPDIKPENPPERASHYIDAANMPWENTKFPGIRIKVLYSDANGITTALFKLDPGAVVPLHEHTALEQTYVLEGTLEDPRKRMWTRSVRLAASRQPARGDSAERCRCPQLFSQAQSLRVRGEVFHRGGGEARRTTWVEPPLADEATAL